MRVSNSGTSRRSKPFTHEADIAQNNVVYMATMVIPIEYVSSPWTLCIFSINITILGRAQLDAARTSTGPLRTTSTAVVLHEASLQPLSCWCQDRSLRKVNDKAYLPPNDDKSKLLIIVPQRYKQINLRNFTTFIFS